MRQVPSSVYTRDYYLHTCLGGKEFQKFYGTKAHSRIAELFSFITIKKGMRVLDIGCGRGDYSFYCAKKGAHVVGIDYAKDAIELAKMALKKQNRYVKERVQFVEKDIKDAIFPREYFDLVIAIDVFEHLYPEELEVVMQQIRRILKSEGSLLVHTEVNKIYLDFTHPLYCYPVNALLIWLNKIFTGRDYEGLPKDPRNEFHKIQHVNEPTYFYLKELFQRCGLYGSVTPKIPFKPTLSWKDVVYNILVWLWPVSSLFPLHLLFAYNFICVVRKKTE